MKAKIYECENCNDCPIKSKCTKAKGNKRIQISPVFITKRKQSQDNITSEFGILSRMSRYYTSLRCICSNKRKS